MDKRKDLSDLLFGGASEAPRLRPAPPFSEKTLQDLARQHGLSGISARPTAGNGGGASSVSRTVTFTGSPDRMLAFTKEAASRYGPQLRELRYDGWAELKDGKRVAPTGEHRYHVKLT